VVLALVVTQTTNVTDAVNVVVSATLIFRLLSFHLPPIWGYVALRWLKQRDDL
jgi:uncharacterized membrane protein YbhN (UPF0104 family)